jgi:hypothetical protein
MCSLFLISFCQRSRPETEVFLQVQMLRLGTGRKVTCPIAFRNWCSPQFIFLPSKACSTLTPLAAFAQLDG